MAEATRWYRQLALRIALRLAGPLASSGAETMLHGAPCPSCGSWRCPLCSFLILNVSDHGTGCWYRRWAYPGGP